MIRKLVVNDGRSERELLMVGTIVVGRDPSCHITDIDPLLSRRHAEFVSGPHGVTIRNLDSRNGILVNGDKMPEHALRPGDVVQMGHLHVRYVEEYPALTNEEERMARERTATGAVPAMAVARPLETVPERDLNATIARSDEDETRAPAAKLPATKAAVKTATPTEAHVVANSSLIVMEASPSCQQIIGVNPDTILGGRLADALTRSLGFVTSGDGPSSLSLTVTRAASGRTVTIVFKAGQPTRTSS